MALKCVLKNNNFNKVSKINIVLVLLNITEKSKVDKTRNYLIFI